MKLLIYGHNGFIGQYVVNLLKETSHEFILGMSRCDDDEELEKEILRVSPDRILSFAGRVRGDNIKTADYLEQPTKLVENVRDNLYSPIILAMISKKLNIHLTYLGTGCIFNDNSDTPAQGFSENSIPNFFGSNYSIVKGFTDQLLHHFESTVLNLRIRMPIVEFEHPLNLVTKLVKYEKICSNPNAMTVMFDLMPILIDLSLRKETGTLNLTNPGNITHNEILEMYRDIIDPKYKWENFTIEEQNRVLKSQRSNNTLNTTRLETLYPHVLPIKEAVKQCLQRWKKNMSP